MKPRPMNPREKLAYEKALAIVRGVLQHPSGFLYGMDESASKDPIEASIRHRLSQLGFSDDEIATASAWSYAVVVNEYDNRPVPRQEWWGHA